LKIIRIGKWNQIQKGQANKTAKRIKWKNFRGCRAGFSSGVGRSLTRWPWKNIFHIFCKII
jgi:hypothetical protein